MDFGLFYLANMSDVPTSAELIECIVQEAYGHADLLVQHHFRSTLQQLVELAMAEQRCETAMELQPHGRPAEGSRLN